MYAIFFLLSKYLQYILGDQTFKVEEAGYLPGTWKARKGHL